MNLWKVLQVLYWASTGINMNVGIANYSKYADEVVIMPDNHNDIQLMLTQLQQELQNVGLQLNENIPTGEEKY